jgi:hypothetical protein
MESNIFLISDASYSMHKNCAGLGVVDMHSKKRHSQSVRDVKGAAEAEYRALLLSVQIAIENKYDNVVFVYDYMHINTSLFKKYLDPIGIHYQFLWLKREFVKEADSLANKARKLEEKLNIKVKMQKKKRATKNKKLKNELNPQQLMDAIRAKPIERIVKFCLTIAENEEKKLVHAYFKEKKTIGYNPSRSGIDFLMFLYQLLPKEIRKNFYQYVESQVQNHSLKSRLIKVHPINYYETKIERIVFLLQNKDIKHGKKAMIVQSHICLEELVA